MRRVFLLLGACLVMSLVVAPAAMAQQLTAEDFREFGTGGYGCEADQYVASAPGDPGEATLRCFDSAEAAAVYSNTGQLPQTSETQQQQPQQTAPTAPADQYVDDDSMTQLPDTGGPSLLIFGGGFALVLGGLLLYRRLS